MIVDGTFGDAPWLQANPLPMGPTR